MRNKIKHRRKVQDSEISDTLGCRRFPCLALLPVLDSIFLSYFGSKWCMGGSRGGGGRTQRAPSLKLEKIRFFSVKSWFSTRNTPKVRPPWVEILDPPLGCVRTCVFPLIYLRPCIKGDNGVDWCPGHVHYISSKVFDCSLCYLSPLYPLLKRAPLTPLWIHHDRHWSFPLPRNCSGILLIDNDVISCAIQWSGE